MDLLLLSVGDPGRIVAPDELTRAGARSVEVIHADTEPPAVDQALDGRAERRLVIDGDLAGLNLVLRRLMRRGELDTAETAVLPRQAVRYLSRIGLPADLAGQIHAAVHGVPRLVGVIKDDSGGLCIDNASMAPWRPGDWWLRAVVDDQRLADGNARSLSVWRLGPDELAATARLGSLRTKTRRGRSLQLACDDARIVADGMLLQRPRAKRTFWSEPKLWQLALPSNRTNKVVA
jgi:hypothetical protein